jgi:hypothetical protein
MLRCPVTGRAMPTGVEADPATYESLGLENNSTVCPHCGETHLWSKKNVYFDTSD